MDTDNSRRVKLAQRYHNGLASLNCLSLPKERENAAHVYHLYVIRFKKRDGLQNYLKNHQIGTLVQYPAPVHQQPAYRSFLRGAGDLACTERIAAEILSLPMYPELEESQIDTVINAIRTYVAENL